MEIDLLELFRVWKKKLWLIILVTFLGGTAWLCVSEDSPPPMYTSTSMMYAVSKETTSHPWRIFRSEASLTQDYKVIITSRPVLEEVIGDLDLNISYEILKSKISINNPGGYPYPGDHGYGSGSADGKGHRRPDCVGIFRLHRRYYGNDPPKIIEEGQVPTQKSSPSNTRNAALGALLGLVLTCGITAMQMILNDTIQTEEDVERYLDLTVLASVPRRNEDGKGAEAERKSKKKKARTAPRENQESQKPEGRSRRKGGKE